MKLAWGSLSSPCGNAYEAKKPMASGSNLNVGDFYNTLHCRASVITCTLQYMDCYVIYAVDIGNFTVSSIMGLTMSMENDPGIANPNHM